MEVLILVIFIIILAGVVITHIKSDKDPHKKRMTILLQNSNAIYGKK